MWRAGKQPLSTADANQAFDQFVRRRVFLVSPAVATPAGWPHFRKGVLVHDPDGHPVKVIEQ
jgi:hypothetical protein